MSNFVYLSPTDAATQFLETNCFVYWNVTYIEKMTWMHAETDSTGSLTVASGESILFPVPTNATKKKENF